MAKASLKRFTGVYSLAIIMILLATIFQNCGESGLGPSGDLQQSSTSTGTEPQIIAQPIPLNVSNGGTIMLSVIADGTDLNFQWQKDGAAVVGQDGPTLTISPATAADSGSYVVEISNTYGAVMSEPVAVTVAAASTPTPTPTPVPAPTWVFEYNDNNGCNSCDFGCDAICTEARIGKTKACKIDGTNNNFKVYRCKR